MSLKAPSAAQSAGRETIKKAFKDLERAICPVDSRDFASTTIGDVRRAAIEIERQLAARQSLRNMRRLEPLFLGLEHYSKVIEVLCNGTEYLAWIWAPIKLILKVSTRLLSLVGLLKIKSLTMSRSRVITSTLLSGSSKRTPRLPTRFGDFNSWSNHSRINPSSILPLPSFTPTFCNFIKQPTNLSPVVVSKPCVNLLPSLAYPIPRLENSLRDVMGPI